MSSGGGRCGCPIGYPGGLPEVERRYPPGGRRGLLRVPLGGLRMRLERCGQGRIALDVAYQLCESSEALGLPASVGGQEGNWELLAERGAVYVVDSSHH